MELKFKEVSDKFKVEVENGVLIKPFYSLQDLCDVYADMKTKDITIDRYFSKVVKTAKLCTNIDFSEYNDEEIFDIVSELNLQFNFSCEIEEFSKMDTFVSGIPELVNDVMKNMGLMDMDKAIESITKVAKNGSK